MGGLYLQSVSVPSRLVLHEFEVYANQLLSALEAFPDEWIGWYQKAFYHLVHFYNQFTAKRALIITHRRRAVAAGSCGAIQSRFDDSQAGTKGSQTVWKSFFTQDSG